MASVHDVAAYILQQLGPISAMKLQKLVYYGQAWSLARRDAPLFDAEIEAWAHGPVVYDLFRLHRGSFVVQRWPTGSAAGLTRREHDLVDDVLRVYGDMSASELSERTHAEAPWRDARARIPAGQTASAVIPQDAMRRFYSSLADVPL